MPFNTLMAFGRRRLARIGLGLLVLAVAAFAQYRLANVPRPVNLETTGKFSPATIRLGREELVIDGPVVNSSVGMLLSHDGRPNETVDARFDRARLDEQTIRLFESVGAKPPSAPGKIDYRPDEPKIPVTSDEPCHTRVELRASQMPSEIHIFQLGEPGFNHYRHLEIGTRGAELVSNLDTASPHDADLGPGCQYLLRVGDWSEPVTKVGLTSIMAEGSDLRLYFRALKPDSTPWADTGGVLRLDLGGAQKLNPNDPPPFQARAISIRALGQSNSSSAPPALISARSTDDGPLISINDLTVASDQLQLSISGNGWVTINGEPDTVNFLKRVQENPILLALLAALDTALLAWVTRLILKTPSNKP
jgi:hypothetical protein